MVDWLQVDLDTEHPAESVSKIGQSEEDVLSQGLWLFPNAIQNSVFQYSLRVGQARGPQNAPDSNVLVDAGHFLICSIQVR